jgi:hypothetical protein
MVTDNGDQNGHQVTSVYHCITSPQAKTSQLLAFEPLLQTHLWIHVLFWDDQHVKEECR